MQKVEEKPETGELKKKEELKFKTYVLYFQGEEIPEAVPVTIEEKENELENLKIIIQKFLSYDKQSLFPKGISLNAIYTLEKKIVIDLNVPEGLEPLKSTREEMVFLKCLAKTICLNFQKYKSIFVLINGSKENNFIKHIALNVSFKP